MNVRTARPDEYEAARSLMVEAYSDYAAAVESVGTGVWDRYRSEIADLESRTAVADLLVAEDGGVPQGAVTYYPPGVETGYAESWPWEWASFRLLAVPHRSRGRGVGRLLTEACIERARTDNASVLALGTTVLMTLARQMYERMGFIPLAEHDYEPAPGITVFCYVLKLA